MSDIDGWTRNTITLRVPVYMAALDHPWLLPDPNPFPRLRLWRLFGRKERR